MFWKSFSLVVSILDRSVPSDTRVVQDVNACSSMDYKASWRSVSVLSNLRQRGTRFQHDVVQLKAKEALINYWRRKSDNYHRVLQVVLLFNMSLLQL